MKSPQSYFQEGGFKTLYPLLPNWTNLSVEISYFLF